MNVGKRKSDECHYCANQKRHDRKRSKLSIPQPESAIPVPIKPMIPVQGNFKCRGRGGREIEFPMDDWIPLKNLLNSNSEVKEGKNGMSEQNDFYNQKINFKPQPKKSVKLRTDPPKNENYRSSRLPRSSRAAMSIRSDSNHGMRLSSRQLKPKVRYSADELSVRSQTMSIPKSIAKHRHHDVRSDNLPLLLPTQSDGQSSTDDSSVTTCLTRSRFIRKVVDSSEQASRNSKSSSISLARGRNRSFRSLTEESRSLRTSNESVHDYLNSVSKKLQRDRLIGFSKNVDQSDRLLGNLDQPNVRKHHVEGLFELKNMSNQNSVSLGHQPKQLLRTQRSRTTKCSSNDQLFMNTGKTEPTKTDGSFWSRVFHILSLGCWKTEPSASSSPSLDQKSEASTISIISGESSSSDSSSTSTGTTTVAAVAACGGRMRSGDVKSTDGIATTKAQSSSRSSGSGDHKIMAAKLVESLKRFFSRHRKSDSDREPNEASESITSTEEENSEPSSSAPLNPKPSSLSSKQQKPLALVRQVSPNTIRPGVESSPESEGSNKQLLGDPADSSLSTENETSDAEIVDICPMHKQPM